MQKQQTLNVLIYTTFCCHLTCWDFPKVRLMILDFCDCLQLMLHCCGFLHKYYEEHNMFHWFYIVCISFCYIIFHIKKALKQLLSVLLFCSSFSYEADNGFTIMNITVVALYVFPWQFLLRTVIRFLVVALLSFFLLSLITNVMISLVADPLLFLQQISMGK